jgi:hypothetical protein
MTPRLWLVLLLTACVPSLARAATLDAMVKDLQQLKQGKHQLDLVWWIPTQYWDEMLKQDGRLTAAQRSAFLERLDGHSMFAIVSVSIAPTGSMTSRPVEQIYEGLEVRVGKITLHPLDQADVPDGIREFIGMMRPVIAQALGAIGRGMEFVVFRNLDDNGNKIVDPLVAGAFEVQLNRRSFRWRLPIGSLLPPRLDPVTGEEFPGNFQFNPFTGEQLMDAPAADPDEKSADKASAPSL